MPSTKRAGSGLAEAASEPALSRRGPNMLVLIAGAGIAGLAASLALARRGIASHVLERRAVFAEEGAGIQIGPNGTRILADLGVAEVLEPFAGTPDSLRVMDGVRGTEITRLPLGAWIEDRWQAPYWTLHRADLHGALLKVARTSPLIRITIGSEANGFSQGPSEVTVTSEAGARWTGDVLLAADGIWSGLRGLLLGEGVTARFSGRSAMRSVIPAGALPEGLSASDVHIWLRPGTHVVHYPVRGGAEIAIVLIVEDREPTSSWGLDVLPATVRRHVSGFPEPLAALMSAPRSWRKWSLNALPATPRHFARSRVALLGDAAHPVLPFLAQGGVMALEDAVVVAQSLADQASDVPGALLEYERRRMRRTSQVARASRQNGRIYHLSGLAAMARDTVLRTLPPERLMMRYDWLYGWRC